jgi:hypothetical protein
MAISGVVRCGGGGKERGKRVEGPGRVETSSSSSSWKLGARFCSCCCWALLVVVGGASQRERERVSERESVRERE